MKFLMQIFQGEALEAWSRLSEEEQQGIAADYAALNEIPGVTPGDWLAQPEPATTVRVQGGSTVTTDGPFAETKEALGGYFLFEGDDLEAASVSRPGCRRPASAARSRSVRSSSTRRRLARPAASARARPGSRTRCARSSCDPLSPS